MTCVVLVSLLETISRKRNCIQTFFFACGLLRFCHTNVHENEGSKSKKADSFYKVSPFQDEKQGLASQGKAQRKRSSMNINEDHGFDAPEDINSMYITEQAMSALWDMCISPMEGKLSQDEMSLVSIIGVHLKMVAEKAVAYEKLQKGEFSDQEKDNFYRN